MGGGGGLNRGFTVKDLIKKRCSAVRKVTRAYLIYHGRAIVSYMWLENVAKFVYKQKKVSLSQSVIVKPGPAHPKRFD